MQARLGPDGVTLYAGGANTIGVQVLDNPPRNTDLRSTLGDLFAPRAGRDSHYAPLRFAPNGPGTFSALADALAKAFASDDSARLLVWIAGHGGPGDTPADVTLSDWLGRGIYVDELTAAFTALRPFRMVQTTCYGGGFAEVVLANPTRACGFFATTWDLAASGCDPDPERARDSYGALFLAAATPGKPLSEAHVSATIGAPGFEVPLMSSQAWLERQIGDDLGAADPNNSIDAIDPNEPLLAEERAIVAALTTQLGVTQEALPATFEALVDEETQLAEVVNKHDDDTAAASLAVRAALLGRWPVLDDPWHPDFAPTLASQSDAIRAFLDASPEYKTMLDAEAKATTARVAFELHTVKLAPYDRALLALRTMQRAAIAKAGVEGSTWLTFEALRRCERESL